MQRCLQLAKNGLGTTRPNPMVGCVIVYKEHIIAEGYTSAYGGHHAEVNAINSVADKTQLKNATLYVSLEPCAHFGKTPPCANLIVKHQIPNVVIGCLDDNELVAGKGVAILKEAGCNVTVGVLEQACKAVNIRFFTFQNKKRPYIILKWAETIDGYIAPLQKDETKPVWITNAQSRQLVHQWRSEEQAILVGTKTVIDDDPTLNVRNWKGTNPLRIVLDKSRRIPKKAKVLDKSIPTIVLTDNNEQLVEQKNLIFETIDFSNHLAQQIIDVLFTYHIQSIIIEGGAKTLQTFIDANLWDEARIFTGNRPFKNGIKAPKLKACHLLKTISINDDILKTYLKK